MPTPGRLVWDHAARLWAAGSVAAGGAPWRLSRLSGPAASLATRVRAAGELGASPTAAEAGAARALVARGLLHPRHVAAAGPHDVTVVVPAFGRDDALRRTLRALAGLDVLVVDDGTPLPSPIADAARDAGAQYLRLDVNSGPAAARNAGLATATTSLVAFVDSDCEPARGWLDHLVPFFEDPCVAVVAPRIVAKPGRLSLLARYEASSSALDMGSRPALVRPGSRLGFLPSATMLVKRTALVDVPFDASLRLGEDVDLVWRLADSGAHIRYEPSVTVAHELRGSWRAWVLRRFQYGTSSAMLAKRHPGRLAPLSLSPWSVGALGLLALGRPTAAAGVVGAACALLASRLARAGISRDVATRVVAAGVLADCVAVGHVLRREYWPVGLASLATSPWLRGARLAAGVMLAPVVTEWVRERPALDPLRYTGVRLLADASYGSGVIASCVQGRTVSPLLPRWRHARQDAARAGNATPPT